MAKTDIQIVDVVKKLKTENNDINIINMRPALPPGTADKITNKGTKTTSLGKQFFAMANFAIQTKSLSTIQNIEEDVSNISNLYLKNIFGLLKSWNKIKVIEKQNITNILSPQSLEGLVSGLAVSNKEEKIESKFRAEIEEKEDDVNDKKQFSFWKSTKGFYESTKQHQKQIKLLVTGIVPMLLTGLGVVIEGALLGIGLGLSAQLIAKGSKDFIEGVKIFGEAAGKNDLTKRKQEKEIDKRKAEADQAKKQGEVSGIDVKKIESKLLEAKSSAEREDIVASLSPDNREILDDYLDARFKQVAMESLKIVQDDGQGLFNLKSTKKERIEANKKRAKYKNLSKLGDDVSNLTRVELIKRQEETPFDPDDIAQSAKFLLDKSMNKVDANKLKSVIKETEKTQPNMILAPSQNNIQVDASSSTVQINSIPMRNQERTMFITDALGRAAAFS